MTSPARTASSRMHKGDHATLDPRSSRYFSSEGASSGTGYTLWEYRAGAWSVIKAGHGEGYQPGSPPSQPGKFEGEIVRKYCEPILDPPGGSSGQ